MKNLFLVIIALLFVSGCINENVVFKGRTTISDDGALARHAEFAITLSGDRTIANDSLSALEFFNANFGRPDSGTYSMTQIMNDSTLVIRWDASFPPDSEIGGDYKHFGSDSSIALNAIALTKSDKWFFEDFSYVESFSDKIDTVRIFADINASFASATRKLWDEKAILAIGDSTNVRRILIRAQELSGIGLYKMFLQKPDSTEYLLHHLEEQLHDFADSMAGFAGNRAGLSTYDSLLLYYYGASTEGVWDRISANAPGLFGSYGLEDSSKNKFAIELLFPGGILYRR